MSHHRETGGGGEISMTTQQQHTNKTVHSVIELIDHEMRIKEADGFIISREEMQDIFDHVKEAMIVKDPTFVHEEELSSL
jgi:hypothetical protein